MIQEICAKTVLTGHNGAFPTLWDMNPYRGCTIGCKYCFAQYSHVYLGLPDFFKDIVVKTNVAEQLHRELKKKSWAKEQIKLGGISDIYQHTEKKYALLPMVFDVLKKAKNPVFIQTKSILIYRDMEIIKELAKVTTVDISASISTFDEKIRKIIEPGAASTLARMEMLRDFKAFCRKTVVAFMPIIPLISDDDLNLDTAFRLTKEFDLETIIAYPLHLRNTTKKSFLDLIQAKFPEVYPDFVRLYRTSNLNESYTKNLFRKIELLRQKYQLYDAYEPIPKTKDIEQLRLF